MMKRKAKRNTKRDMLCITVKAPVKWNIDRAADRIIAVMDEHGIKELNLEAVLEDVAQAIAREVCIFGTCEIEDLAKTVAMRLAERNQN
jgi:hypothetical protein